MIETLLFATSNPNKVLEIRQLLGDSPIEIVTMAELGYTEEIPETGNTLEQNALLKAEYLYEKTGRSVISEDTGLEVDALNGEPGVRTARYAGDLKDTNANMELLLENLSGARNRNAQFRTVIALITADKRLTFEGIVRGIITNELSGTKGFGYDPVFIPEGFKESFAEMDMDQKSSISHRGRALTKLINFLKK